MTNENPQTDMILMPVFNDWTSVEQLLQGVDSQLTNVGRRVSVLLVDDGSPERYLTETFAHQFESINSISVIRLARNIGHQRAICIGLAYIEEHYPQVRIIVMDSDGEDDPADMVQLLKKADETNNEFVVFAARTKRSENWVFRICYHLYRFVHLVIVGQAVRVGNFSVVPNQYLSALTTSSDLWNHYAATIYSSRIPFVMIPSSRSKRIDGKSQMNFVSLIVHGLSAISVFSERIGARLLAALIPLCGVTVAALLTVLVIRFSTALAVPGWATTAAGILLIILLQLVFLLVVFSFIVLSSRTQMSFLPVRDYQFFVIASETVFEKRQNDA